MSIPQLLLMIDTIGIAIGLLGIMKFNGFFSRKQSIILFILGTMGFFTTLKMFFFK